MDKKERLRKLLGEYGLASYESHNAIENDHWYEEEEIQELMDKTDELHATILLEFGE